MKKAFDEGWGGVICKTLSLDSSKVVNVTPRYAKLRDYSGKVFGWQNFELISDRPFETMLAEMKRLREEYPNRILIASIMEEYKCVSTVAVRGACPHWLHASPCVHVARIWPLAPPAQHHAVATPPTSMCTCTHACIMHACMPHLHVRIRTCVQGGAFVQG